MKRLSDYQGEEAIELWADLLDPISDILTDKEKLEDQRILQNIRQPPQSGAADS